MTISKMCAKIKNVYLWKFFEFICTYRNPFFILLKPIIETTVSFNLIKITQTVYLINLLIFKIINHCFENEEDFKISKEIRTKLDGLVIINNKSKNKITSH